MKKRLLIATLFSLVFITACSNNNSTKHLNNSVEEANFEESNSEESKSEDVTDDGNLNNEDYAKMDDESAKENDVSEIQQITISAAGDCTLGTDLNYSSGASFINEYNAQQDYSYFFKNVKSIFEDDDLTIVNLEGTFTEATQTADKKFKFKAPPHYVNILKEGNIEAVNIANNHIYDYLDKGYQDTVATLEEADVEYFGNGNVSLIDVNDIKVGLVGYTGFSDTNELRNNIKEDIQSLKDQGASLVIASFHWGIEREYYPYDVQKNLAHYAIDSGADLILGHHPHVVQGIEVYKDKNIIYSFGNFCFGGNKNPSDKDTFIYKQKFTFEDGELVVDSDNEIIPCSISSVSNRNNYQPTPLEGAEKERVMTKIEELAIK
ncbi:CapA family protein [Clostridium sp. DL1XJH146]